jgi:hypothetical protein
MNILHFIGESQDMKRLFNFTRKMWLESRNILVIAKHFEVYLI